MLLRSIFVSASTFLLGMMSTTPKLENFFGGVTIGTPELDANAMYCHQNYQIQPLHHYQDYSGLYSSTQHDVTKIAEHATSALYLQTIGQGWISNNYHTSDTNGFQSLNLSMNPGFSQSSTCVTISQQKVTHAAANVTENVYMETKKRGSEKVDHQKKIKTSQYKGVTRYIVSFIFFVQFFFFFFNGLTYVNLYLHKA